MHFCLAGVYLFTFETVFSAIQHCGNTFQSQNLGDGWLENYCFPDTNVYRSTTIILILLILSKSQKCRKENQTGRLGWWPIALQKPWKQQLQISIIIKVESGMSWNKMRDELRRCVRKVDVWRREPSQSIWRHEVFDFVPRDETHPFNYSLIKFNFPNTVVNDGPESNPYMYLWVCLRVILMLANS